MSDTPDLVLLVDDENSMLDAHRAVREDRRRARPAPAGRSGDSRLRLDSRLVALGCALSSGLALAAPYRHTSGGGCCSLLIVGLFTALYRRGGADWVRSLGTAIVPGLFGWFIWRDRALTTGSRWTALIFASLQVFFVVVGVAFALAAPALLARVSPPTPSEEEPVDLTNVPEDPALGLHPLSLITSDPPGARVLVNGQARGKTPLETPLSVGARNEVQVELEGYFPATRVGSPNARERLALNFTLKSAARLEVTSHPAGARVLVGLKEVLAKTPGLTSQLEPGNAEVLVLLDGYRAHVETLPLAAGATQLAVTLQPGVKIAVTSTPEGCEVFLDGQWLGLTPTAVFVSPRGQHTLEVKKEGWATAKKVFASVTKPTTFSAKLVDTERVNAQQALAKARARYDRVNSTLEKLQKKIESIEFPPAKLEAQRVSMERDMEKAAGELERAEHALKEIEEDARDAR